MADLEVFIPCDRCGKRSLALWLRDAGQLLLSFCGHHSHNYGNALRASGWHMLDEKVSA